MTISVIQAESDAFDTSVDIPTMLSDAERALYFQVAANYSGKGGVFELGPWLGGSTLQICRGLEASGHPWKLTVLDRFRWSGSDARAYPSVPLKPQDSSFDTFRDNLSDYEDRIDAVAGDFRNIEELLPVAGKIELLFIDGPSTWRSLRGVLKHLVPHLLPGATVVFQDLLHIPSRQVAWLVAHLTWLKPTFLVDRGTTVSFTVVGSPANFDQEVPEDMQQVETPRLLEAWRDLASALPEARACELTSGLAIDMLERDETRVACEVLDRVLLYPAGTRAVVDETSRLMKKATGEARHTLLQVLAYLRFGTSPDSIRRAVERLATAEAATEPTDSRDEREIALAAARSLSSTRSAPALALRHVSQYGFSSDLHFRRLFTAMQSCIDLGLPALVDDYASIVPGTTIVDISGGPAFNGLVLRALGAARYIHLSEEGDRTRRSYRHAITMERVKTSVTPEDLTGLDPQIQLVDSLDQIEDGIADLVLIRPEASNAGLKTATDVAARLLKPNGLLRLSWRNPRSWSGHGKAPQTVSDIRPENAEQAKVIDWQHLKEVRPSIPSLAQLRSRLDSTFRIEAWEESLDDPETLLRMNSALRKAYPTLDMADFTVHTTHVIARV